MKKFLTSVLLAFVFLIPQLVGSQTSSEGDFVNPCIALSSFITYGSTDAATQGQISILQDFLIDKGLLVTASGGPTGYYGMRTVAAVKKYQESKGIIQTGTVGPLTRAAIASETGCSPATSTSSNSPAPSDQSASTSATRKSYSIVVASALSSTGVSTKEEALARCMASKTADPSLSIWCFWDGKEIYYHYPSTAYTSNVAGNGTAGANSTTANSSFAAGNVGVSSNAAGPFASTLALSNASSLRYVYIKVTGLDAARLPRFCIASPSTPSNCEYINRYHVISSANYISNSSSIATLAMSSSSFTAGTHNVYITYTNEPGTMVGSFAITGSASTTGTGGAGSTPVSTSTTGAVFGIGPGGVPGSQPVTYNWYAYTGSMLLWQGTWNLGYPEPTVPCTASNVGATYYLGKSWNGTDVVATCYASNQQMAAEFATVTSSTFNQPRATSTSSISCTYTRGTFTSGDRTIEWANGGAACTTPPADATGWVSQGSGVWHRVVSTVSVPSTCSYTTGSFTDGGKTVNWACGSATCTGAPAGSGWTDQGNGCYHQPAGS